MEIVNHSHLKMAENLLNTLSEVGFGNTPKKEGGQWNKNKLMVWAMAICDMPQELLMMTIAQIVRDSSIIFFPRPQEFRAEAYKLLGKPNKEDDLIDQVLDAWRKFKKYDQNIKDKDSFFDGDEALKKCILALHGDFAVSNISETGNWFARFRDLYKSLYCAHQIKKVAIPEQIKNLPAITAFLESGS